MVTKEIPTVIRKDDPHSRLVPKKGPNIFQRLNSGEPTAAEDCVHTYGAYVSELAKYNMPSDEEASVAAAKIFDDIHAFARSEHAASLRKPEIEIIRQIAVSRIVKQLWDKRKVV